MTELNEFELFNTQNTHVRPSTPKSNLRLGGSLAYVSKFLGKILRRLQKFREQRIEQDKLSKQRITSANSETTAHLNSLKRKQGAEGGYNVS